MDENAEQSTGRAFIEGTKRKNMARPARSRREEYAPQPDPVSTQAPTVRLGEPAKPTMSLQEAMERRRSHREYSDESIPLADLSYLAWATQGLAQRGPGWAAKTVPSAGAAHPIDTYILVNRVDGVPPGLYWYRDTDHSLVEVDVSAGIAGRIADACLEQEFVAQANAAFVWVAVPYRTVYKYGERGYRYIHLDAGHICQNLYLAAEGKGMGCCGVAAFDDDKMNALCGLDGDTAFVVYVGTVGRKA